MYKQDHSHAGNDHNNGLLVLLDFTTLCFSLADELFVCKSVFDHKLKLPFQVSKQSDTGIPIVHRVTDKLGVSICMPRCLLDKCTSSLVW